jgi:hypothetical protein
MVWFEGNRFQVRKLQDFLESSLGSTMKEGMPFVVMGSNNSYIRSFLFIG